MTPDEVDQRRVKADLILDANLRMGIDASAVGDQDLRLGVEFLHDLGTAHKFPFLSANLVRADGKTVFPPHMMKTVCGVKVGIFSVMTAIDADGKPVVPGPNFRVDDPIEAAKKEVATLKAEGAQAIVALTHIGLTEDLRLAREVPGIALVFGGHSRSFLPEPQKAGSTWVFQAGYRSKELGRLDLDFAQPLPGALEKLTDLTTVRRTKDRIKTYDERIEELTTKIASEPDADRKTMFKDQIDFYKEQKDVEAKNLPADGGTGGSTLKNTLVDLNRDLADEPQVGEMVHAALAKIAKMPAQPMGGELDANGTEPGPKTGPYVGAQVCQGCHVEEYKTWSQTDHAKAYKSLVADQRALDFDCVGCHTTGYKKEGGPKDPFTVAGMTAVQCEVCHGPGRAHATDPKAAKLNVAFDEAACRTCHSTEQTGDRFVFAQYLPKVDHGKSAKAAAALAPTPAPKATAKPRAK
jgi:hypothetical protein